MYIVILVVTLFSSSACSGLLLPKPGNNYGPYDVEWSDYSVCEGVTLLYVTYDKIEIVKESNNNYVTYTNVTVKTNLQLDSIKILVYSGKSTKELWKYKVNRPCQHLVLSAILTDRYSIDDKCNIKQGRYYNKESFTSSAKAFFGQQFFYGDFTFRVTVFGKQNMFTCVVLKGSFVRKKTK